MKVRTRHRAFATMTAMAMVLLVAVVAAALTTRFAVDARITQRAEGDAQLRQLLLAGMLAAERGLDEVAAPAPAPGSVTLVREGNAVRIKATLSRERRAEQVVVMEEGRVTAVGAVRFEWEKR